MLDGGWRKSIGANTSAAGKLIERAIERAEGGAEDMAARLTGCLHRWLLRRAKAALDTLDDSSRATSKLLDRVASLLQEHGELAAAEPLCREQVAGRNAKLGENHPDALDAANNLALLLHQLGKLDEAEPLSRQKLAGCRKDLGDNHPDTVTAIDTLSQLLADAGKLEEALPLKRESLAVKRQVRGRERGRGRGRGRALATPPTPMTMHDGSSRLIGPRHHAGARLSTSGHAALAQQPRRPPERPRPCAR